MKNSRTIELPTREQSSMSAIESLVFAYQSVQSLLHNIPDRPGVIFRPIYEENARTPEQPPLNAREEILPRFMETMRHRSIVPSRSHHPYWNRGMAYNSAEVFGATIQSFDLHDASLPRTVLPPEADIACFIERIRSAPYKVKLNEQLETALDITDNDLLGAVNICWIGTRFMARGADRRAYPAIPIDVAALRDWNSQIAQFKTYNNSGLNDGPGDTYYFWTHAFAAMAFSNRGYQARLAQAAFSRGTQIMAFTRKYISTGNQPNITAHEPASTLGREAGLGLAMFNAA